MTGDPPARKISRDLNVLMLPCRVQFLFCQHFCDDDKNSESGLLVAPSPLLLASSRPLAVRTAQNAASIWLLVGRKAARGENTGNLPAVELGAPPRSQS